jgi:hypothetical protein
VPVQVALLNKQVERKIPMELLMHSLRHTRIVSLLGYFILLISFTAVLNFWEYHRFALSSLVSSTTNAPWLDDNPDNNVDDNSNDVDDDIRIPIRNGLPLFDPEQCNEPMQEWQDAWYPNCNMFHSIDLADLNNEQFQLLGMGGARMVWKVNDVVGQQGALKTLIFKNAKFDESKAEHTRVDAILSERLTSSSHVIDIYGACGMSTMSEIGVVDDKWVSRNGAISPSFSNNSTTKRKHRTKLEKLSLAIQLANALADFHSAGSHDDDIVTAVWRNLKSQNVLFVNGKLKINDFDDSILVRRNESTGKACTFQLDANVYQNKTYQPPELCYSGQDLDEKIDIYALGGILYGILTRARPYNDLRGNYTEIKRRKQVGIMPTFAKIEGRQDIASVALRKAIEQCLRPNPKSRPSARRIARDLEKAYKSASKEAEEQ